tara:strand:+ start:2718 stop:4034 length:1317 start_codon:yes stop_codon:yes gene_type:complete
MFGQLQNKFTKIFKTVKGHGKISEKNIADAIREIRIALLESDVNFKVVKAFIEKVKQKASGEKVYDSITPGQQFIKIVLDELISFLDSEAKDIKLNNKVSVIVLSGLQGAGKTTTAAKVASFLTREKSKKPLLVGLDLQRPAAMEQLKILADKNNIDCYIEKKSKDVLKVLDNSFNKAKELKSNVLILDTAGRLHIDDKLILELREIIKKSKPDEILYVADGMTGQDAVNSSKVFSEQCDITGCVITKMDGDSGGGVALSIKEVVDVPIKFITFGEKNNDIEVFNPDRIARRILGLDDVIGLVEQAQKSFDLEEAKKLQDKLKKNSFDLNDFKSQLEQFKNFGNLDSIMKYIPKMKKVSNLDINDKKIIWIKAIIDSMTENERKEPSIINGSRKKRISIGCGRPVYEINQLLKQFNQMKIMMKKMKNMGSMGFPFGFK